MRWVVVVRVFALFARGAESRHNFVFSCQLRSSLSTHRPPSKNNMADEMGSVITIENFTAKMSSFDPNRTQNHLYGLVDMGRYSPMLACSRTSRSNAHK